MHYQIERITYNLQSRTTFTPKTSFKNLRTGFTSIYSFSDINGKSNTSINENKGFLKNCNKCRTKTISKA